MQSAIELSAMTLAIFSMTDTVVMPTILVIVLSVLMMMYLLEVE